MKKAFGVQPRERGARGRLKRKSRHPPGSILLFSSSSPLQKNHNPLTRQLARDDDAGDEGQGGQQEGGETHRFLSIGGGLEEGGGGWWGWGQRFVTLKLPIAHRHCRWCIAGEGRGGGGGQSGAAGCGGKHAGAAPSIAKNRGPRAACVVHPPCCASAACDASPQTQAAHAGRVAGATAAGAGECGSRPKKSEGRQQDWGPPPGSVRPPAASPGGECACES